MCRRNSFSFFNNPPAPSFHNPHIAVSPAATIFLGDFALALLLLFGDDKRLCLQNQYLSQGHLMHCVFAEQKQLANMSSRILLFDLRPDERLVIGDALNCIRLADKTNKKLDFSRIHSDSLIYL